MLSLLKRGKLILWFKDLSKKDGAFVGGKTANLGEMYNHLASKGIPVPNGFAITAKAFKYFIKENNLARPISELLDKIDRQKIKTLQVNGEKIRELIESANMPKKLEIEITEAYRKLVKMYGETLSVAVRSSATAEDLPGASFAGQQETYLNIQGEKQLITAVRKCFASLYTDRAISYREDKGFDHSKVYLSVAVQKMIRSDKASSGVIFTIDTDSGFKDVVSITSAYGLGESVVQGIVNPDQFFVHKPTLKQGFKSLISKSLGSKKVKIIYSAKGTRQSIVGSEDMSKFSINDEEILQLARYACIIEDHYRMPMDIEWAKDGAEGKLYILQARPETVHSTKQANTYAEYILKSRSKILAQGLAIGEKIGSGEVNAIRSAKEIGKFKDGEVLVTEMTNPDWGPVFNKASAIVTEKGGRTCFGALTKILTDKGFLPIEMVYERIRNGEILYTLSLDSSSYKLKWRQIAFATKRKAEVKRFKISPALQSTQNFIDVTEDHEFLTLQNRNIIKVRIGELCLSERGVLVADRIPTMQTLLFNEKESYLRGVFLTDGHYFKNKQGGYVVGFTQKLSPNKQAFIKGTNAYIEELYSYVPKFVLDKRSNIGSFQCYSKQMYQSMMMHEDNLILDMLTMQEGNLLNFLGGVFDGDGNISSHQLQITISEKNIHLLEAVVLASLRLGIVPSICKRRTWFVVSYSSDFERLLRYSKRIKLTLQNRLYAKRFVGRQILSDIVDLVNQRGRIKYDYITCNLLMSGTKIEKDIIPKLEEEKIAKFRQLLDSDFSMQRASFEQDLRSQDVYNLTISADQELDHNYLAFTTNYTPVIAGNCHAAIVSRELGVPCIVGAKNVTKLLKQGSAVTVSCAEGEVGNVYAGKLSYDIKTISLKDIPHTHTKVMMNLGLPEQAFKLGQLPHDGVGLAREEFIISDKIKIHPLALINYIELRKKKDPITQKIVKQIDELTQGYPPERKRYFYVDKLAEGIATIAASFYPNPVIVRFSDFKTNEYRSLIGGELYEPEEENPMIGWRGASRYYSPQFKPAFELECKAIAKVRGTLGLRNVKVMVPFCRTLEEAKKVLAIMMKNGLRRSRKALEVYMMVEIPSDVILLEDFCKLFDGFSIGTNDLTQLVLGVDRDSSIISNVYDERNAAVRSMVASAIKVARKNGKKIGICGDAPSTHSDFTKFLVEQKIDSISVSPDVFLKTKLLIAKLAK